MKSYLRTHIISSIVILSLALGAAHMLADAATGAQSQSQAARQEISQIMQRAGEQQPGTVPTLGQIGQHIGGIFNGMIPR